MGRNINPFNFGWKFRFVQNGEKKRKENKKDPLDYMLEEVIGVPTVVMENRGKLPKISVDFPSPVWCLPSAF